MDGWTVLGSVILANTIQMQKKWKSWLQDRGRWNVTFNILGKYEEIWTVMKKYGNMEGHLYRKKLQDCPLSTIWTTWYGNVQECRLFLKWLRKISLHCYIFLCMYMHFFLSFFFLVFFFWARSDEPEVLFRGLTSAVTLTGLYEAETQLSGRWSVFIFWYKVNTFPLYGLENGTLTPWVPCSQTPFWSSSSQFVQRC